MKNKFKNINYTKLGAIIVSSIIALSMFILLVSVIFVINMLNDKPAFDINKFNNTQSSKIYDKNNNLVAEVGLTIRENVDYNEVPTSVIDAFVATEDSRFFTHNGFDLSRFTKAILDNVVSIVTRRNSGLSGASTLTMQLVKNSYFTDDQAGVEAARSGIGGIERKLQEISLSLDLEQNVNKKTIIEYYLNKMNFGANGRGIQNAAKYYFNKDAKDLTLSESALLAGVVNSPYYYNPFNFLERATNRRNTVLRLMLRHGYISEQEYKLATAIKVEDLLVDPHSKEKSGNGNDYQAYIDVVISEVERITNLSPYSNPMIIYTHLDTTVQKQMDKIQNNDTDNYIEFPDDLIEVASIAVNNETSAIIGVLGGRNYSYGGSLLLNHATDQYKQPGSTIKTILEYPLAFEKLGWSTSHTVLDKPITYKGTNVIIGNAIGKYYGQLSLMDAVALSLNTVAISTFQEVIDKTSVQEVVKYMNNMGYTQVNNDNFNIQYAIGGADLETSVLQQAGAQAAIINGGVYHKPHTIRKIEFLNGREPISPIHEGVRTLSSAAAFQTTELLKNNLRYGFGYAYGTLKNYSNTVYAKSGTSDWGEEGLVYNIPRGASKDVWVVASSADYTVATWSGYEKAIKDKDTYFNNEKLRANISGKTTELILDAIKNSNGEPKNSVPIPDDITSIEHIVATYPYANLLPDMNQELIARGYIAKKYAQLVSPEELKVKNIEDFNATIDSAGNLKINWKTYPDQNQTVEVGNEMDISLKNGDNIIYQATGARLFDYSWVYGPIQYKAKIFINDAEIEKIVHSGNELSKTLNLIPGNKIKICGYYGYKNKDIDSNQICKEFQVEDRDVTVNYPIVSPNNNLDIVKQEYQNWAKTYNTKVNINTVYVSNNTDVRNEMQLNSIIKGPGTNEIIKASILYNSTFEVTLFVKGQCENGTIDPSSGKCLSCNINYRLDEVTKTCIEN